MHVLMQVNYAYLMLIQLYEIIRPHTGQVLQISNHVINSPVHNSQSDITAMSANS